MSRPRQDPDLVRPYVRTGGRTRPSKDVRLESLVFAATGTLPGLSPDARRVIALFAPAQGGGLAVADIASALALPPSTTRILVADLIDHGLMTLAQGNNVDRPPASLLERVLNGLRANA
ncbi:hypothetical protein GCM10010211_21010 [Streptomyces albospinus]|uniref:DUF742 domain-containing protein n=1 Tax=Streptomyces albospinus TaxID=285515 RepID=A0ABQ2UYG3_9ACTN|nr:DUF742 domain-containing protein [Streptomyces albospinus]GGU55976.1 hypothetical protein GCM10010211_21010 [Streptomyces albospinus]